MIGLAIVENEITFYKIQSPLKTKWDNVPDSVPDNVPDNAPARFGEGSEKSSEKIMDIIREDNTVSGANIAKIVGLSQRAVEKQIAELKKKKKLKRIGPDKGGHWEVVG